MAAVASERVRVFWQPGCTSCLRTKEFLARNGVDFESINVHGNAAGMEELRKLGARSVPIVARGGKLDRKSTRLNSSHIQKSRMPSSA